MLEIFFYNVGDGDAVLLRERRQAAKDYNMLVDAGRPFVEPAQGSFRKEAIYFLKARGVGHLDRMVLTHLHIDHIGGAQRILKAIPTERLSALYAPPADAGWITPSFTSVDKTENGLKHLLNIFRDVTETARETGCEVRTVGQETIALTEKLSVSVLLPKAQIVERQKRVFDALYRNEPVDPDEAYKAAKQRNLSSLMLLFTYAERSVLITGDRYAADWEDEPIGPVDVLKLPHHGDPKSMTEGLLRKLSPQIAVISCQSDPRGGKDRPNAEIVRMLQDRVPQLYCTENRALETLPASTHNGIRITIDDYGAIACETE